MATIAEMNWIAAVDVRDQLKRELQIAERELAEARRIYMMEKHRLTEGEEA